MDAEDLVGATVLQAFEQFERMDRNERFLNYLIKIASRLHKRRRYRERKRQNYDEAHALNLPDMNPMPDTAAEIRIVMDALNTLPEKMRETVILFDVSDFTLEEIRAIQSGTISGVKSRLKRGREMLARNLGVSLHGNNRQIAEQKSRSHKERKPVTLMEETPILILANQEYVS